MANMRTQVALLASAQALVQIVSVVIMTIGALAGATLAGDPAMATAPVAAMFLGTAVATVPASMWMARVGRRTGFVAGAVLGVAAGLVAALGMAWMSLTLLCVGTFLAGAYQGFAQFYRFAAAEVADAAYRPRAISLVLAGGVVAALVGPWLARAGIDVFAPFVGSFLVMAAASAFAVLVLWRLQVPATPADGPAPGAPRPWRVIVLQPVYLVALFGAVTGYGVMILAMTATPLAMAHHHHGLNETAMVIQLHVLGMFVPSFFTGALIARFGVLRIMLTGVVLLVSHVLLTLSGTSLYSFTAALILLGIGWNFLLIGGTTLLTQAYTPAEKGKAQATNDLTIFLVGLAASLAAGPLQAGLGWQWMNLALLPWLALAATALLWLGWRGPSASERPAASTPS